MKQSPTIAPLHPWIGHPSLVLEFIFILRVHFWGLPTNNIVDAHSKWVEILEMSSTTAWITIQELHLGDIAMQANLPPGTL